MAFPTVPHKSAPATLLVTLKTAVSTTHTFSSLSSLTKASGDLLIAVVVTYDGNTTNAEFSAWGAGFTEFVDQATATTMGIGAAFKISDGSETGTFTVTSSGSAKSVTYLMAISGAHASTVPEATTIVNGTAAAANPAALNPAGWDAEETLWIAVVGNGEDATTGSFTGPTAAPANYALSTTDVTDDVVGSVGAGLAFRQLNAASEDVGTWTVDTSSARNSALVIAVRPAAIIGVSGTATPAAITPTVTRPAASASGTTGGFPIGTYSAGQYGDAIYGSGTGADGTATPTEIVASITTQTVDATGSANATVTPASLAVPVSTPAASASGGSAGSAAPGSVAISTAMSATAATGGGTAAPAVKVVTTTVPIASSAIGGTATPAATLVTTSVPAPAGTGNATATIAGGATWDSTKTWGDATATWDSSGGDKIISVTFPAAAATGGSASTAVPGAITVSVTSPAAAATGGATTTPTVAKLVTTTRTNPVVAVTVTTAPAAKLITTTVTTAAAAGTNVAVPVAKVVTTTVPTASVFGGGSATAGPNTFVITTTVPAAAASGGGGVTTATPSSILVTVTVSPIVPPLPEHPVILPSARESATVTLDLTATATIVLPTAIEAATVTLPASTDTATVIVPVAEATSVTLESALV